MVQIGVWGKFMAAGCCWPCMDSSLILYRTGVRPIIHIFFIFSVSPLYDDGRLHASAFLSILRTGGVGENKGSLAPIVGRRGRVSSIMTVASPFGLSLISFLVCVL